MKAPITSSKLRFKLELRKKGPVYLIYRDSNTTKDKREYFLGRYEPGGNPTHIVEKLRPEEEYEFQNFIADLSFAHTYFGNDGATLDRLIIKVAPEFKEALVSIWVNAQAYGLEFTPDEEMLRALLHKAKTTEQLLAILTEGEFKALEALSINTTSLTPPKRSRQEETQLYLTLIENTRSLETLASLFNTLAQQHGKTGTFKAHHFESFKNQGAEGKPESFLKLKWYSTIAVEALMSLKIKPDTIIPPARVAHHWLHLNKKATLDDTYKAWVQAFKHLKDESHCRNIIKMSFVNDALSQMARNQGHIPPAPSHAIEEWLRRWNKTNPNSSMKETVKAFNKEFPLFANNPFFIDFIEKDYAQDE